MNKQASLLEELNVGRKEIKTDSYSMSIGEIINLYKDGELELNPAYQRLFRWDEEQKSKFVESILLGIPLPPIFVAQKEGGKWSIVDGLQRTSTILQLTGELKIIDKSGTTAIKEPLVLTLTKKLPSLEGLTWDTLPEEAKRILKRSKFGVNIILTENSIQAQYELFQRLNTGGVHLEPQEIRNCLIIMLNEGFYDELNSLKDHPSFINSLPLQEDKLQIEYHMELILRYFIAKHGKVDYSKYKIGTLLLPEFLDNETINLMNDSSFDIKNESEILKRTFDFLYNALESKIFQKYYLEKGVFEGGFSISSFEAITTGVAVNLEKYIQMPKEEFEDKIKGIYKDPDFINATKRGTKVVSRFKALDEFSRRYFA